MAGSIIAPGLVDTHWHIWTSLLRNVATNTSDAGYFAVTGRLGAAFRPEDMRLAALLAAAEAIDNGITTVHDWCHNVRSPAHARAALIGLREAGLRARFSYGATRETPYDRPLGASDFASLHETWGDWSAGGLLTLGIGWRGVLATESGRPVAVPENVWRADLDLARDRGLPVSVHANNSSANSGHIRRLAALGLLGPDLQVIHAVNAEPDEIQALASNGASVFLAPSSELTIGFGVPLVAALMEAGVPIGISVDTTTLTGSADLLNEMKLVQGLNNAQSQDEFGMSAMDALGLGTRVGAATLGLGHQTGTLTPGKRADLIVVDRSRLAMLPNADPATMMVRSARAADITMVMIDGRILKRDGRLTQIDSDTLRQEVMRASARLGEQASR